MCWVSMVQLAPSYSQALLAWLFNPFQTQPSYTLTIQSKGTSCPFPALPEVQNKSPFLSVDVTKWSVPKEAVWQGGLDGKSFAVAL